MIRRILIAFTFFACAVTNPAHAETTLSAGFAPGQVWLSKSSAQEGETVQIYTVVYNSSATPLEGSVNFDVDGASMGATPFSLAAGSSVIKSVPWKATEGTHHFKAEITSAIETQSKEQASVASATTSDVTIAVGGPAPTLPALSALTTVLGSTASATPALATMASAVVGASEAVRKAGITYLATQATTTLLSTASSPGSVLGAETYNGAEAATEAAARAGKPSWLQMIARVLLPIFSSAAIFYPVLFVLIIFILWCIARRMRNPSQSRAARKR